VWGGGEAHLLHLIVHASVCDMCGSLCTCFDLHVKKRSTGCDLVMHKYSFQNGASQACAHRPTLAT
jgi:hypothetical protein